MSHRLVIAAGPSARFGAARARHNAPATTLAQWRRDERLPFNRSEPVTWAEPVKRSGAQQVD